jgi:hypothetical protein
VLILAGSDVHAQLVSDACVKVGLTSASTFDSVDNLDRRTGVRTIAFVEGLESPLLSVVAKLGYVQRGFSESREERNALGEHIQDVVATTRLDYVSAAAHAQQRLPACGIHSCMDL